MTTQGGNRMLTVLVVDDVQVYREIRADRFFVKDSLNWDEVAAFIDSADKP